MEFIVASELYEAHVKQDVVIIRRSNQPHKTIRVPIKDFKHFTMFTEQVDTIMGGDDEQYRRVQAGR